jgi:hypothetical protein
VIVTLVQWNIQSDWDQQEISILTIIEKVKTQISVSGRTTKLIIYILVEEEPKDKETKTVDEFLKNIIKNSQMEKNNFIILNTKEGK